MEMLNAWDLCLCVCVLKEDLAQLLSEMKQLALGGT